MDLRIAYLLDSNEPWTRYRTLVDILDFPEGDPEVESARQEMMAHPQVQELIGKAGTWPGYPLKRHNDARHPLYAISTLADFGLQADDPGIEDIISRVVKHTSPEGMLETQVLIPRAFGGTDKEDWTWLLCDSPTLLYSLLTFQGADQANLAPAVNFLSELVYENGWHCTASPDLGKFKGPGRREEPCPIANVYALKSLSTADRKYVKASKIGTEMLLHHWEIRKEKKYFLFGMGTDFSKLKYPFVWYDILHVVDVLSRFPWVHNDPRFKEMLDAITTQADENGRYTANSMYMAWKGWSFADKKNPSPWITFLVLRIQKRMAVL
jgi:hypothetical protein